MNFSGKKHWVYQRLSAIIIIPLLLIAIWLVIKYSISNDATYWRARTLFTKEPLTINWIRKFEKHKYEHARALRKE